MSINKILDRLRKVKKNGKGYRAICPGHQNDKSISGSLSLLEAKGGRILMHCHAGCAPLEVLSAIGLRMADLFPESGLDDFKGFEAIKRDVEYSQKKEERRKLSKAKTMMCIAESDWAKGIEHEKVDIKSIRIACQILKLDYLEQKNKNFVSSDVLKYGAK